MSFFPRRIRLGILFQPTTSLLPRRTRKRFLRIGLKQLPTLGRSHAAGVLSHRSRLFGRIKGHSLLVRNHEHIHQRGAAHAAAIRDRFTVSANGWLQVSKSTTDDSPQDARSESKSRRLFAVCDDVRQLLETAGVHEPRIDAPKATDCCQ